MRTHQAEKVIEALREQEEASKWSREHAAALDKNWSAMHEAAVGAIRAALGMPDASVPEMVARIRNLLASERSRGRKGRRQGHLRASHGSGDSVLHRPGLEVEIVGRDAQSVGPVSTQIRTVVCRRVSDTDTVVCICPFCGNEEVHGAGGRPWSWFAPHGHAQAIAHCQKADVPAANGYRLVLE